MSLRTHNEMQRFGKRIVIGIITALAIGVIGGVLAWVFLPTVPAGGWSWVVRGVLSFAIAAIAAYISWIIIVVLIAGGIIANG